MTKNTKPEIEVAEQLGESGPWTNTPPKKQEQEEKPKKRYCKLLNQITTSEMCSQTCQTTTLTNEKLEKLLSA